MYESMINSLKAHDTTSTSQLLEAKLQASEKQALEEEIAELKDFRRKLMEDMGNKEHEYMRQLNDKEAEVKDAQMQIERVIMERSQQLFQWEIERKELQQKYQKVITEREQAEMIGEIRFQSKINELQGEVDKVQLAHMVEIEKIKAEYENSIKDMKLMHEQEKYMRQMQC
jgi:hypothetical protein